MVGILLIKQYVRIRRRPWFNGKISQLSAHDAVDDERFLGQFRQFRRAAAGMSFGRVIQQIITEWRRDLVKRRFHQVPRRSVEAYRLFNRSAPDRDSNFAPQLIRRATEFGYMGWPRQIRAYVSGKDILDVGCGTGIHSIGYVTVGARSYTGVDPRVDLERDRVKDLRNGQWTAFGANGREIMNAMPRVELHPGGVETLPNDQTFDVVILHNVTEHLPDLEQVFCEIAHRLRRDGLLIFNHHNFYCWNGHHLSPKHVADVDSKNSEQSNCVDWAHLAFDAPDDHYIKRGLNRIRLHELRALTAKHFDIIEWTEKHSKPEQGAGRLTPEIRARYPEYSLEEFLTQNVFCRCAAKGQGWRVRRDVKSSYRGDMSRDQDFVEYYGRCAPYTMTTMERLYGLYQAVDYVVSKQIPGDLVECGVWRGGSMMMAAFALLHFASGQGRTLYLYDTFAGMSAPSDRDFKFGEAPARQKWEATRTKEGSSWNLATLEEVRLNMLTTNYPGEHLRFVKGDVQQTIPQTLPERIALLRLDTDFHDSTRHELEHLYPRLVPGGILIIDDYGTWAGSKKAVDEYFAAAGSRPFFVRLDSGERIALKPPSQTNA